jgi:hypothetical protein
MNLEPHDANKKKLKIISNLTSKSIRFFLEKSKKKQ